MAPQMLLLITAVGPPDCAKMAFPFAPIFPSLGSVTDSNDRISLKNRLKNRKNQPAFYLVSKYQKMP
jgi:hypothetical protein